MTDEELHLVNEISVRVDRALVKIVRARRTCRRPLTGGRFVDEARAAILEMLEEIQEIEP